MTIYKCKKCGVEMPEVEYVSYDGICNPCFGDGDETASVKVNMVTFNGRKYVIMAGHSSIKYQLAIDITEEHYRMAVIGANSEGKVWEETCLDVLSAFKVFPDKTTQTQ